ncbi:MAG TPA: alpha/beta hydrolase [Vineibacter sp.]|nr:alpha/beta hydrolase [Vineibacter sp.]
MLNSLEAAGPPSRALLLLEGRALWEAWALAASFPFLCQAPRGDGHGVLVLPGLMASDASTAALRGFLGHQGYVAQGWGLGLNLGLRQGVRAQMLDRLLALHQSTGRKVSLIGWSLGGIYARELAKYQPEVVRTVITLGSPFAGHPRSTHAWRLYETASGQQVGDHDASYVEALRRPPPMPTTAIYSRTDGICAWQSCRERSGDNVENIEVHSSHCGLGHHPAVIYAVADRLAQAEGAWRPFDRSGWRRLVYPDPSRGAEDAAPSQAATES